MRKIREVIVVEGRYDKNTLSQIVDATVVTLGGFAVFNDREKVAFLRRLAEERGLIVLTDSDGAGFVIRNYLKGALPRDKVKQAYIPDIRGKEKRKRTPGKEGKLGVEGMKPDVILEALRRAGVTFLDEETAPPSPPVRRQKQRQTPAPDIPDRRAAASRPAGRIAPERSRRQSRRKTGPAFSFCRIRLRPVRPPQQVVGADVVVVRQLNDCPYRYFPDSLFITPVYVPVHIQVRRYFNLRLIMIDA